MSEKQKILIVEDDKLMADVYVESLANQPYDVEVVENGKAALKRMSKGGYDLVLLDVILPEMDGWQILTALKNKPPKKPNKKLVLMSNMAEENLQKEAARFGINEVMIKSDITPGEMAKKVKEYLGG